ncbi:hypothetical protein BDF22DRAFT_662525 [Syncephalis plumigaleata]|nr:hypothetical protein BDF22DRAFT_662525 [Syncephalis plumigaleata]
MSESKLEQNVAITATESRQNELCDNLATVQRIIKEHATSNQTVRLVAVSKTKPASDIAALYTAGQRHFGENYLQELVDKSKTLPSDICWHFIGGLQSNKCKQLADIPNLWMVETLDSRKRAELLNRACMTAQRSEPLRVMVQVNTSGEESKHGVTPSDVNDLCYFIHEYCPALYLAGLMTIGAPNREVNENEVNPDFESLKTCRDSVAELLNRNDLELSMGMSDDYAEAIDAGSTNVRVGSKLFGARSYPNTSATTTTNKTMSS